MKINKIIFLCFFLVGSLIAQSIKENKLTLGFMPYLSGEILLEKYTPLAKYLSQELGMKVEIVIAKDYTKHIEDTGEDRLDISFLGGSPYVVISDKYGKKPLLARYEFNGKPTFNSVVFVAENSKIKNIGELKGTSFAFGNKKSTLSTQVPLYMLMENGVELKNLERYSFLTNHENVIYGVALGDFTAGSVAGEIFKEKQHEGIRLLEKSQDVSTHVFVTRSTMDEDLQMKIQKALLNLKSSKANQKVLKAISGSLTGFVEAKDSDYDYHRKMLGLVLPVLK